MCVPGRSISVVRLDFLISPEDDGRDGATSQWRRCGQAVNSNRNIEVYARGNNEGQHVTTTCVQHERENMNNKQKGRETQPLARFGRRKYNLRHRRPA
jgi:hypothetical protein